jgi:hypothetical protein
MEFIERVAVLVCGVLLAFITVGAGTALADPFAGKTYAEAAAVIAKRNGTPIVATMSGNQLAKDDCIVISGAKSIFLDSSGHSRRSEYLLNLNCNRALAAPGHPGGSLMSPGGLKAKKDNAFALAVAKQPEICDRSEAYANRCARVCPQTKLCEYAS